MGRVLWDCYSYYTAESTVRDERGEYIRPPAAGRPRDWRGPAFERFRVETVAVIATALDWLNTRAGRVAAYLWNVDPTTAPNLADLTQAATAGLIGQPFAYEWRCRLPDAHLIVLAVRGYWDTTPQATVRRTGFEASPKPAPRRSPSGRRYFPPAAAPQGPQPNSR